MTSSVDTAAKPGHKSARWHSVKAGDPQALTQARMLTLNIVQWLARIANSYVADRAPEERVALEFRAADGAFVTKTFDGKVALAMRLPSLELQFLENGRPAPHILDPEEHSPAEVEAWLLVELLHRNVDRTMFSKKLPYSIPDLMSGDAEDYSPLACSQGLADLAAWFLNAAAVLEAAASASGVGKASIVCGPQTLNLTCASRATEFGFSPGNGEMSEPYFYTRGVNATPGSKPLALTASKLLLQADPAAAALAFLTRAAN